jgi:hypothetical protein
MLGTARSGGQLCSLGPDQAFNDYGGSSRMFAPTRLYTNYSYLLNPGLLRLRGIFGSELSVRR